MSSRHRRRVLGAARAAQSDVVNAAGVAFKFDGVTDFLTTSPQPTGETLQNTPNSKVWSGSMWLYPTVDNFKQPLRINVGDDERSAVTWDIVDKCVEVWGVTSTGSIAARLRFPASNLNEWAHYAWSFDLATAGDTPTRYAYKNGSATGVVWEQFNDAEMAFNGRCGIGATPNGGSRWGGAMADIWIRFGGEVVNLDEDLDLFLTEEGKPADPTGWPSDAQIMLFGNPITLWHRNRGTGGGFRLIGTSAFGPMPVAVPEDD